MRLGGSSIGSGNTALYVAPRVHGGLHLPVSQSRVVIGGRNVSTKTRLALPRCARRPRPDSLPAKTHRAGASPFSFDGGVEGHADRIGPYGRRMTTVPRPALSRCPMGSRYQARPVEFNDPVGRVDRCCQSGVTSLWDRLVSVPLSYGHLTPHYKLNTGRLCCCLKASDSHKTLGLFLNPRRSAKLAGYVSEFTHVSETPSSRFSTSGEWRFFCETSYSENGTTRLV
jgi:hypothetical protein